MDSFSKIMELLNSKGYKLIRNDERSGVTVYEHAGLFIKIEQEHGQRRFIDLSRTNNYSWQGWYDMTIVYHFIQKTHYQKSSPSRFDPLSPFSN